MHKKMTGIEDLPTGEHVDSYDQRDIPDVLLDMSRGVDSESWPTVILRTEYKNGEGEGVLWEHEIDQDNFLRIGRIAESPEPIEELSKEMHGEDRIIRMRLEAINASAIADARMNATFYAMGLLNGSLKGIDSPQVKDTIIDQLVEAAEAAHMASKAAD